MRIGRGQGCGKLILFGEHAVVYGHGAVAFGLERGARACVKQGSGAVRLRMMDGAVSVGDVRLREAFGVMADVFGVDAGTLDAEVSLEVPAGAGLGGSAALAVALSRAIADFVGLQDGTQDALVERAVALSEGVFHGSASGIDQVAAMGRGLFGFRRLAAGELAIEALELPVDLKLVVCQAEAGASTSEMVGGVAAFRAREPEVVEALLEEIGAVSGAAVEALQAGDVGQIGALMDRNHALLGSLGVSTVGLDRACVLAKNAGAVGAKLTGAGGGGCVVALVDGDAGGVVDAWNLAGLTSFEVVLAAG